MTNKTTATRSGVEPPPVQVSDSVRRLQIGIAGVLTVLLLVGMAGLIGDRARESAAQQAAPTAQAVAPGTTKPAGSVSCTVTPVAVSVDAPALVTLST